MKRLTVWWLLVGMGCACGSREEGTQLHLGLDFQPTREISTAGTVREFTTAQGDRITLSRASLTLNSVEIFPCESSAGRWWRLLSPIGTAEAHEVGSPRRLGVPHVSGLERPDGEGRELGLLRPPPGRYCRARLVFAPADADAEGLSAQPDMEGKTLRLEGQWRPAAGGPARPFVLETDTLANAEVALDGLSLTPETLEAWRTVHLAYDRWLDGVEPTSDGAAEQVLHNVTRSATLTP